jgi:hypothetical protein
MPAFASVPFADNCIVAWFGNPAPDVIRTCPTGDWDMLDVTVMDQFGLPIPLQTVTVTLGNATELCAGAISGATDASGYVRLNLPVGTLSTVDTPRISSTYTVSCMGYTIKSGTVDIMSADYNCNPTVDALDFSFFAQDWLKVAAGLRSDFNNDGSVDALDYSLWALHWLHS